MVEPKQETWGDMVRRVAADYYLTEPSDDEVEFILWERTAFPFDAPKRVERQVREYMMATASAICQSENGGPSGKGHCSVCSAVCFGS